MELAPGVYEYKYVCKDWAQQEDVPADCGVDNGQGGFNRSLDVSFDEAEYYYNDPYYYDGWFMTIDDESWGTCPPKDFCEVFDCVDTLHATVIVDTSEYDFTNFSNCSFCKALGKSPFCNKKHTSKKSQLTASCSIGYPR